MKFDITVARKVIYICAAAFLTLFFTIQPSSAWEPVDDIPVDLSLPLIEDSATIESDIPEDHVSPQEEPEIRYARQDGLTPEQVITDYMSLLYDFYLDYEEPDIQSLVDDNNGMRNALTWVRSLVSRREIIDAYDLCYVEKERFPYTIIFIDESELEAEQADRWRRFQTTENDSITLHFTIEGEKGKVYPPFLAVNADHSMRLVRKDGEWFISSQYFPGSVRKFRTENKLALSDGDAMYAELLAEFGEISEPPSPNSTGGMIYNGAFSAAYAGKYAEDANDDFYRISDWMGDCANFTSQCILAGFIHNDTSDGSEVMTRDWFASTGGGSPAWENVGRFWEYMVEGGRMKGSVINGAYNLLPGDLIQTSSDRYNPQSQSSSDDGSMRYNHSMIVVDSEKMILAQHSPANFVYFSDLVNSDKRYFRPYSIG